MEFLKNAFETNRRAFKGKSDENLELARGKVDKFANKIAGQRSFVLRKETIKEADSGRNGWTRETYQEGRIEPDLLRRIIKTKLHLRMIIEKR